MTRLFQIIFLMFFIHIIVYAQISDCSPINPDLCYIKKPFPPPTFELEKKVESKADVNSYHIPILADINGDCVPEIICPERTYKNWDISNAIYIIESKTGNTIKRISTAYFYNFSSSFLIADSDKDGMPEIYLASIYPENPQNLRDRIICYNLDGTVRWISDTQFAKNSAYVSGAPCIVDFNKDGIPELYIGNDIFNALTGVKLADGGNFGVGSLQFGYVSSVAGQLDQDTSDIELAAGYTVYKVDITNPNGIAGNKMTPYSLKIDGEYRDGSTCLADINLDGILDIIVSSDLYYYPYLYAYTFSIGSPVLLAKTNISPSFGSTIGPPTIGDIDATGIPTILIISNDTMRAFHYDNTLLLQLKWNFKIDIFAQNSGITLFDFDNNGVNEIIFGGPSKLYLIDGSVSPPLILSSIGCKAGTFAFYPIVADIDNSGHTKICTTCYIDSIKAAKMTIFAPLDSLPGWAPARRIWNQYNYNVLNINDDLTVPQYMKNNATYKNGKYNNFRQQESLLDEDGKYLEKAASLYGEIKCVNYDTSSNQYEVIFDVINSSNASKEAETDIPISFYDDNPGTTGELLGTINSNQIILPGDTLQDLSIKLNASDLSQIVMVVNSDKSSPGVFNDEDFKIEECDYTDNFYLTLDLPEIDTLNSAICEGQSYDFHGKNLVNTGKYFYKEQNIEGCDSLIELLNLKSVDTVKVEYNITACDEYKWYNFILTQSATYYHSETNSDGCDSIEILTLTINNSVVSEITQTSCDSIIWQGNEYTETGIYEYKTQTVKGCDSISNLNLTINRSDKITLSGSACNSYTWNGNTYTESGMYQYNTVNASGCDSIVTLNLTISDNLENADTLHICEGDSIDVFGQWVSEGGEYSQTFVSQSGCDSIQTYRVVVDPLLKGSFQTKICEGDSLYIIDRWFSLEGNFEIEKHNADGCDSLIEINIIEIPLKNTYDTISLCRGDTIIVFGEKVTDERDLMADYLSSENCDSTIHLHVAMLEPVSTESEIKLCPGDSVIIGGNWIRETQKVEEKLIAESGCDSISMTEVTVISKPGEPEYVPDCESREITVSISASPDWHIKWDNGATTSETTYKDRKNVSVKLSALPDCSELYEIELPEIPDINIIKIPRDTVINRNETIYLDLGLDAGEWQIEWATSQLIDCYTCSKVNITIEKNTEIKVYLNHESGCSYELSIMVYVGKEDIIIPNIFSPDGDGLNDVWKISIPSGIEIKECSIYDRWGEKIYSSTGAIEWDGTFKGKKAMSGVYVYVIEYKDEEGKSQMVTGDVTVLR